jgi:hypothetical protein
MENENSTSQGLLIGCLVAGAIAGILGVIGLPLVAFLWLAAAAPSRAAYQSTPMSVSIPAPTVLAEPEQDDTAAAEPAIPEEIRVEIRVVGVSDGRPQFRIDDELLEGEAALTESLRATATDDGDPGVIVRARIVPEPEVALSDTQVAAIKKAARAAGRHVDRLELVRWERDARDDATPVVVDIIGTRDDGNRYRFEGRILEGEEALSRSLRQRLAERRAGLPAPAGKHTLDVKLRAELAPGVTATEDQIEQARETLHAAGVERPATEVTAEEVPAEVPAPPSPVSDCADRLEGGR